MILAMPNETGGISLVGFPKAPKTLPKKLGYADRIASRPNASSAFLIYKFTPLFHL